MYWPDNAHTDGANPQILAVAKVWLDKLYTEAKGRGDAWIEPYITTDPKDGDIILQWHWREKYLCVYVSSTGAWFWRDGPGEIEKQSGDVITETERREAWQWIVS